ncbi:MAG: hypothetical protein ACYCPT_01055 [Acidimicrobiales bacterium]
MDRTIAATPTSREVIDLTHGDTRAFAPPESAMRDFVSGLTFRPLTESQLRGMSLGTSRLANASSGERYQRLVVECTSDL